MYIFIIVECKRKFKNACSFFEKYLPKKKDISLTEKTSAAKPKNLLFEKRTDHSKRLSRANTISILPQFTNTAAQ
jgi:hypothetical protein